MKIYINMQAFCLILHGASFENFMVEGKMALLLSVYQNNNIKEQVNKPGSYH